MCTLWFSLKINPSLLATSPLSWFDTNMFKKEPKIIRGSLNVLYYMEENAVS